jgi:hypothetical protein
MALLRERERNKVRSMKGGEKIPKAISLAMQRRYLHGMASYEAEGMRTATEKVERGIQKDLRSQTMIEVAASNEFQHHLERIDDDPIKLIHSKEK